MMRKAHVQLVAKQGTAGDKLRTSTWIEVQLIGEDDQPIAGEVCEITLPGGKKISGWLDDAGVLRVDQTWAGDCQITFPKLDQETWSAKDDSAT